LQRIRDKFTYANVISTIALVLALGGATAFAASSLSKNSVGTTQLRKNAVTGAKVKNGSLTGVDVNASTLNKVPSAVRADTAATSQTAARAQTADVATRANSVTEPEAEHFVGRPGEPLFAIGWGNNSPVTDQAAFYKDREGVVHLQGTVNRTAGNLATVFFLPQEYLPKGEMEFPVASEVPGVTLFVGRNGDVTALGFQNQTNKTVSLAGVTWRAGH
jgi:hypothetical protein